MIPRVRSTLLVAAAVLLGACSTFPTEEDINNSLEAELSSVSGTWTATATGGVLTMGFQLVQAQSGGQVTGSGTMQEPGAATRPVTITGSYQRPILALTVDNMVFEGRAVRGTFTGNFNSAGGIADTLVLTGDAYSRRLGVLLVRTSR